MFKYKVILLFLSFSLLTYSQNSILLKKGRKKITIRKGKLIGITKKGENFQYTNWKFVCNLCEDDLCKQNLFILDSVKKDYIVVKQLINHDSAYIFDTVVNPFGKNINKYFIENWLWVNTIYPENGIKSKIKCVFKYPKHYFLRKFQFDEIESFTFPVYDEKFACIYLDDSAGYELSFRLIFGTPFTLMINDSHGFNEALLIGGELLGFLVLYLELSLEELKLVKTYSTKEWKIMVK
jgi:hypothetical protein